MTLKDIKMTGITIGKLAKESGVTIDTVRFYERKGLIDEPERTASNYRVYYRDEIDKLRFIRKAKELGFSLGEIQELLSLKYDPNSTKAEVKERTLAKIKNIKSKIKDLTRIQRALEHLADACDGHGPASNCPIIKALDNQAK